MDSVLRRSTPGRYAFAVATVAVAFALRLALSPLTGGGATFVLFFGATMATSLLTGVGPALLTLALTLPVVANFFIIPTGASTSEAAFQGMLFAIDGLVIICLARYANRQRERMRQTIELSPDAYFLADLNARFIDVNQAACRLLGYERDELVGMTIFEVIPSEDAERLRKVRNQLMQPGQVEKSEWVHRRKDGTLVPVEVSANILPDGRWQAFVRDITDRKRVEDVRQIFVALLDYSSDFIGIADPAGKPIYLNAAGRRMIGLEPDFPVEQIQIIDCYPPEVHGFVTDVILKTMVERGEWRGETLFQNMRTNERIPVSDTHFMIRDASGERVLGLGTVTRDITEGRRIAHEREQLLAREQEARRELEAANDRLQESEERFRLTVDEAPIGMALVALDGHFVRVNQVLCEITGYSADELTKLAVRDITHVDDLEADIELAGRLARGEIPRYQCEKRYLRKDRTHVDVMLSASVLRGSDGAARYYIAQLEDITARKRAEAALRLSEAKFSRIVSIAADAIISVDEGQRITLFNEGAEEIFGYARSEAIGMRLSQLLPDRLRAAHGEHFAGFASEEEQARKMGGRHEIFGLRKNGAEFPAEASISKVDVDGAMFFSVVLRDVTERKNVEEALRRALAARDDVLGVVAHDLRNPLNTIMMTAQLLERPESPERRDQTSRHIIARSAKRMNALIKDLLDVSVIEAGQLKVEHARVAAADLAREVVEAQTEPASAAGIELRLDIASAVREVWGDRDRLHQVFDNLIGNALKFTSEGGRVTISAAARGQEIVFSVADTGAGMAPEVVSHIFDRFWQAATYARRLGAGLGLPITRGIVEAHGGRIWVESAVGRGCTFFFTIPVASGHSEQLAAGQSAVPGTVSSGEAR
jgi:PAS domain S-box-containing protein